MYIFSVHEKKNIDAVAQNGQLMLLLTVTFLRDLALPFWAGLTGLQIVAKKKNDKKKKEKKTLDHSYSISPFNIFALCTDLICFPSIIPVVKK